MRTYELVCIIHPELDDSAFKGIIEKVNGWISEAGGNVDKVEPWGRRRMAYTIRKQREGQYVLFHISMLPSAAAGLERNIRFQESVLRSMLTLVD
jgi:small subunit ribosomal protein S6